MIIIKLKGGLGNQLFQYALGRSLSLQLNTQLKLNILGYNYEHSGIFELRYFNIPIIDTNIDPLLFKPFKYYKERHFNYNKDVLSVENNSYLDGYWQCEKYFKDIENVLVKDLEIKEDYISDITTIAKEINNTESVSVHIRRGDFLSKAYINNFGVLSIDYYKKGLELLNQRLSNPKFYFFSDDIDWVQRNFPIGGNYFLASGTFTRNSIEDFYLMANCNHHIIANSTFSWWSAWLCRNEQKIVIGPKKWFKNPVPNTKEVLPENWISFNP